jgi:2-oxoglutarate dehydrogenase E1 component
LAAIAPRPAAEAEVVGAGSVAGSTEPPIRGVFDVVHSVRELGHYEARLDPLGGDPPRNQLLEESEARVRASGLDRVTVTGGGFRGGVGITVRELLERLRATYCGTLGVQYLEVPVKEQREWLQERMEPTLNQPALEREERLELLRELVAAEEFERFLHTKYVGAKRFSLEGGESLIPLLETVIEDAAASGVRELIMGMAHRGRLNVLAHTLRKPLEMILAEFEGAPLPKEFTGASDVKYHLGFSHDHRTRRGHAIHLSLSPNPSHLEHVDPVVEGIVRAKQDRTGDAERRAVVPLLIHGDAAFQGQGVVPETLALSELESYRTGGTIHVIVNNNIGFTAPPPAYRFTPYASDLARYIHAPVFHVNGDDPEAAIQAARLAMGFRERFRKDVIVDLMCYRRHGHNEIDDPTFTQPVLYKRIAAHKTTRALYEERLLGEGAASVEEIAAITKGERARLEAALEVARKTRPVQAVFTLGGAWKGLARAGADWGAETRVPLETLERIARGATAAPEGFHVHPKIQRLFEARRRMAAPGGRVDWSTAEMLAFGSLVLEGTHVRLTGQDVGRGTFSQRHAALRDVETDERLVPLDRLAANQARFEVIETMLSEEAVLGFEYGYSWADPWTLVLWEAQFGDFANVAQAMIDVFIAAAESKWQRMSGLVLLLPHGYEGQGPEHSSARLERFLQLSAEGNLQVVNLTTPAQYFHALRRQMRRSFRKPLIVMSPKSLLRNERATSPVEDLASGRFETVLDDPGPVDRGAVRRVLLASGKVSYALERARAERQIRDVAIVRVEQLYPFPQDEIGRALAQYPSAREVAWTQEEPRNMGAWRFVHDRLGAAIGQALGGPRALRYVGRPEAASPATGSAAVHEAEEKAILSEAFHGA